MVIKPKKTFMFKSTNNNHNEWLKDCEFDYTNVNRDKIIKMFGRFDFLSKIKSKETAKVGFEPTTFKLTV